MKKKPNTEGLYTVMQRQKEERTGGDFSPKRLQETKNLQINGPSHLMLNRI